MAIGVTNRLHKNIPPNRYVYVVVDSKSSQSMHMLKTLTKVIPLYSGYQQVVFDIREISSQLTDILGIESHGIILLYSPLKHKEFMWLAVAAWVGRKPTIMFYDSNLSARYRFILRFIEVRKLTPYNILDFLSRIQITESVKESGPLCNRSYVSVRLGGKNIRLAYYYSKDFDRNKPTLFFIHGITANCVVYKEFFRRFMADFNIVCVEMPGHGASAGASIYNSVDVLADIMLNGILLIIKRFDLRGDDLGKAVFGGHSLGGGMATYVVYGLEKSLGLHFNRLLLLSPVILRMEQGKAGLFVQALLDKIRNIEEFRRSKEAIINGAAGQFLYYVRRVLEGGGIKSEVNRLLDIVSKGFRPLPKHSIRTPALIVFSDRDLFFSDNYILKLTTFFRCVRYMKVHGVHEWPVLSLDQVDPIVSILKERG